jgi:poly(3-hydroxybutyrate) depolymerase
MLGPDSRLLTALLVTVSIALLVAVIRLRPLPVRILCGGLSIVIAMTGGIAVVNYYYGYYTSWGQLWADFHGGAGDLGAVAATTTTSTSAATLQSGRIGWISLPGVHSGISRRGLLYLPPQYSQAKYAHVSFPVVELFHGTPGSPLSWDTVLRINHVADALIAKHLMGPMVLVMPAINGSGHNGYQDCVNGPGVNDETYLTQDVRADLFARYRVSHDPYEWGMTGYSSGGYCSANLALRHRGYFGAAAVIEGYFRAADGPAGKALKGNQALEAANSPLYLAERLTPDGGPIPAFWIAAGTHQKKYYQTATAFAAALGRVQQVPFFSLDAADTGNAWQAALPTALAWLWQQLAPPDLRVLFPVRTHATGVITLPVTPLPGHHTWPCKSAAQAGHAAAACGKPAPGQVGQTPGKTAVRA